MFEFSDSMQTVEVITPRYDGNGALAGLTDDTTFYDPEAFVGPVHDVMRFNRVTRLDDATRRYTYIECLSNIRDVNGRPVQLTTGREGYTDYYGRPWAQNWEKSFEAGWDKPETDFPPNIFDIFEKNDKK